MATEYILDTNIFALFFQYPKISNYDRLKQKIELDGVMKFYIPEIVSMEIHSVLGKYMRSGGPQTKSNCNKNIANGDIHIPCTNVCVAPAKAKMKPRVYRDLQKLIREIESQNGPIKANILNIGPDEFTSAKLMLMNYSDRFSFGSHDALVAGTVIEARKKGMDLTLITSDKGLKAACGLENIPIFDPNSIATAAPELPI
jgi:hypothetical protein